MTNDNFDWSEINVENYTVDHTYFSTEHLAARDDGASPVSTIAQIDRELATLPWDLAVNGLAITNPDNDVNLSDLDPLHQVDYPLFNPDRINPVINRIHVVLQRRLSRGEPLDGDTFELAVQLGDLLAASGSAVEALVAYRELLDRLRGVDPDGVDIVARRAEAVLGDADLEPGTSVAGALHDLIPAHLTQQDVGGVELYKLKANAARVVDAVNDFDTDAADRLRIAKGSRGNRLIADLEPTALTNPSVARLQMAEVAALNDPLPVSVLGEAVLDTMPKMSYWAVAGWRGRNHPTRFIDHLILESPLPESAAYEDHVYAVLNTPLRSRPGVSLGDVIYYTGSIPEASHALLTQWRHEHGLTSRHVVINCPHLLRTRPENHDLDLVASDRPTPQDQLAGVVITSLGWGGSADIGALIAQTWGWGFAAATRTQIEGDPENAFGDWISNLSGARRHTKIARNLLEASRVMLDALPHLNKRIHVLDQPHGAIRALAAQPRLGTTDNPLPVVVITMNETRIRWVAEHMLSQGGRLDVTEQQVLTRAGELLQLQDELVHSVQSCNSVASPVMVIDMVDHLEDGYAERHGNDPVDDDFDCFTKTGAIIRHALDTIARAHTHAAMPTISTHG